MIVDIVDKYCTNDNNPIKNLRLKYRVTQPVYIASNFFIYRDAGTTSKQQNILSR